MPKDNGAKPKHSKPTGAPAKPISHPVNTKPLNLALQGGGAHGAFTWGVLDRLLEDGRVSLEGISGTSAGAINAAVLADGLLKDGRDGAREALDRFWRMISEATSFSPLRPTLFDQLRQDWNMDQSPHYIFFDLVTRLLSPYELNPFNLNPLRDILEATVDFDALRGNEKIQLFITATNVRSGKVRVFDTNEVSVDVLMASACLPLLFKAVEIDGEAYWDGGYMGNPAIFPLVYDCTSRDVAIVQVNPLSRLEVPTSARDILNRINEISFNSTLMREMRALATVSKFLRDGSLDERRYKDVHVHLIEAEAEMRSLGASSKMNADFDFLCYLRDLGRAAATIWLDDSWDAVGTRSSVDVFEKFL
ncbi:MAG TPA: patatin-like phospholipase family protein [Candidatus Sulfotelmatobacter sp.]|nr:patatin-like phospholipase family protein [Candidatus Sulfotelmatobacter sp.]